MSRTTPQRKSSASERLTLLAEAAYREVARVKRGDPVPPIDARFYAYAGMRSTVRLREGRVFLRLSDVFAEAPDAPIGGLIRILFAKLLRRKVREEWLEAYRSHARRDDVLQASEAARKERGRKRLGPPAGRVFDLRTIFDQLNAKYFGGRLDRPSLGWTLRDAWRTHGHYDAAHHTIVLSRTLDSPETPAFVVEFVMYHEMLHVAMPSELRDGRHRHHTTAFRRAEAAFPGMREAVAWLEKFSHENGTRRRKRRLKRRG